jgi:hypothetical protein
LFIAPFVFGAMSSGVTAWTAYIGGVLLVLLGLWSLANPEARFTHWTEVVIGVLLFIAPWVFGFADGGPMSLSVWLAGVLAVVLGGWILLADRQRGALAVQH